MVTGSYEGRQSHIPELKTPAIEVFENIYSRADYEIHFEIPEFTAICPKTGLPDFGTIYIDYIPDQWCLELKSLKEYFFFFRDIGIFHENVVNKVTEDLIACASPRYLKVRGDYNIRGGVKTVVEREYRRK
ncbi:MAG: NADPH-dependent 7-cyano-7-deazaguanine reductase QueF [Leptospiraceae bacterium]|nr:NADPH-dependent 7-cyano-7-deazaguanine reductase QueF [Leptospiraceae bacterium]